MKTLNLCVLAVAMSAAVSVFGGTVHEYTSAQTVDTVITGDDSVKINISTKPTMGASHFRWPTVTFTGANSFSGDVEVLGGCVAVSNATALGSGRIKMHPETAILVYVDYTSAEGGLKSAIIDRIDVVDPTDDTWIAFMVYDAGLKNDVDFSSQPYFWLSSLKHIDDWTQTYEDFTGTYTPYGDTYRFGYNFVNYTECCGLRAGNLCDISAEQPRKVVVKNGTFLLGANISLTGGITVEQYGTLIFNGSTSFTTPSELIPNFFTFKDGSRFAPRMYAACNFPANFGWNFTGTVSWAPQGNTNNTKQLKIYGPISGSGTINCQDNGCFAFLSDSNTFTGNFNTSAVADRTHHITIGDNNSFSFGEVTFGFGSNETNPAYLHLKPKTSGTSFKLNYSGKPVITIEGSGSMALSADSNAKIANTTVSFDPLTIASGKTYTFNDAGGYTARILGSGCFALADGATWPTLDLSGYAGKYCRICGDEFGSAVITCPTAASIYLGGTIGASLDAWKFNTASLTECHGHTVHCFRTNYNGRAAFVVDDGCHWGQYSSAAGGVIYGEKIDVSKNFSVDFDFYNESTGGSYGDGLCLALQDKGTNYGGYISQNKGCTVPNSIAINVWSYQRRVFVSTNQAIMVEKQGPFGITDNIMFNMFTKEKPLKVNATWDGSDLKFTLNWNDKDPEVFTYSAAELATKYPSGAYLSFFTTAGGWYCRKIVDGFKFRYTDDPVVETGANATLKFNSGSYVFAEDGASDFAGRLVFAGENTISGSKAVALTGTNWTFDYTDPEVVSKVTVGEGLTLPNEISVTIDGSELRGWQTLVDYSAATGDPTITEASGNYRTRVQNRQFQVYGKVGSVILLW